MCPFNSAAFPDRFNARRPRSDRVPYNMAIESTEVEGTENGSKKRGCGCTKQDFLPEQSFQSCKSYLNALSNTKSRLKTVYWRVPWTMLNYMRYAVVASMK
ncbi:hypothetical protein V6N13_090281 [Hibiscus sabdariffa]|uniref:Uncharacterized protein n=1 Tax=Hibiscus sabdariffa TaxID=183260 RepID=A0ABR2C2K8_9ROSI